MPEWFCRLRAAWRAGPGNRRKSVLPRVTLESFENVKLVPFEDRGNRDAIFLSALDLDDILSNDADRT